MYRCTKGGCIDNAKSCQLTTFKNQSKVVMSSPRRERLFMFALARDGMTKEARELLESREDVDVNASVASLTPLRTASEVRFTIFFFFSRSAYIRNAKTERSYGNGSSVVRF